MAASEPIPSPNPDPPPAGAVMRMMQGAMVAKALEAVAELGIADLLADGAKSADELAAASGTHARSLFRLLRGLAAHRVFAQREDGTWENTPLSDAMRSDSPDSVRDYLRYAMHEGNWLAWNRLLEAVKTGEPVFEKAVGMAPWDFLHANPHIAARFNGAMTALSRGMVPAILANCDFTRFRRVIDIGGGHGLLMAQILAAHPDLRGTVFDLESVIAGARVFVATQSAVADRIEFAAGSFFDGVPSGFDAYLMKFILHDWDDADCMRILRAIRAAIPPDGTLLIFDAVMQPGNAPHPSKWVDLHMMVALGGRERTEAEFADLLGQTGFALRRAVPLPIPVGVIEATPV